MQNAPHRGGACFGPSALGLFACWADHHNHLAAFHFGHVFNLANGLHIFGHAVQQFAAQILVGHFAAAEPQGDFHLVAPFEEAEHIAHFDLVVMRIGVGAEFHLFHLDDFLLFARLGFPFLLFVFELAEIHDFAHGRFGIWGNFDKVQPGFFGHFHGAGGADNADILAIGTNQADFVGADAFVDARAGFTIWRRIMRSAGYGVVPSVVADNWVISRPEPSRDCEIAQAAIAACPVSRASFMVFLPK